MRVTGVVLAAGAGRRMGTPKGLLRHPDGTSWAAAAAGLLTAAGCEPVLVTVGAQADRVRATLPPGVRAVEVPDWSRGPGAGMARVLAEPAVRAGDAVLLLLVDLPHVDLAGVRTVLAHARPGALVRAVDRGRPGHPVLLGRDHLDAAAAACAGGAGLRGFLAGTDVVAVPVAGAVDDVDVPGDLPQDLP
ncbi:NTP transferase domain-containing protein [Kineococcus sp. LSe6-4]|uniref:NTP transferase domain-containing protein n=1 Tax=Kineococcus halophytocola TaxID=3234027 RepID=A0ABV4GYY5_9ACTN